ncbi:MAG: sn-glycerol-3-phosphate ABC transporter ATP-binding protein UgpC [Clostridiales bacterium]|nr:sn-glycerol-3-phosphate ABC transporter ATP-binding protein UgpC [Clostridiales bacterium]
MSEIALRNVCKQFDSEHYGVKDFNLDIHDKEFVIFVGPSGCGKSTTLRIIAGLEEITDGELWIDGELSNYLEPKERGMSMVFQNYALYPNMTVYGNMAYALKIRKLPKDEIDRKVHEVAKILEIDQLLDRRPAALSGGQKQRVAIGSAIIRKPKAFLMDEPLSNLDAKLRAQMRVELVKLHKQLDTTIIYVTHDQTEAMTLGTKIVVMKDGLIQQVGAPQSIYDNPVNLFVAGFLGSPSMNFFRCTVKAEENNRTALLLDDAKTVKKVYLDGTRGKQIADRYNGRHVILGIRPEDIYEFDEAKKLGIENESVDVDESVVNREMLGAEVILYFDEQGKTLAVRLSPENQTQVGEKVSLYFDMEKAHVFDPETEENIFVS